VTWRGALQWVRAEVSIRDVFWVSGLAAATYGAGQIYEPAGWITSGVVLFWMGIRG
jgi:hypothetical protein